MAFDAKEYNISQLLSQNLLEIPRNQRKYVWNETNWSDLISDIKFVVDTPEQTDHFLGSIVLRKEDSINGLSKYSIIDGQQRTITIIIFLLAIIRNFQDNDMIADVDGTLQFIFIKDRKGESQFILHSESHFPIADLAARIVHNPTENLSKILSETTFTKQNEIFKTAFLYFYSQLNQFFKENDSNYLVAIKDALLDAKYIRINADSDADAYTVFEILNARGTGLEDYELLKNYIMRYIHPKEKVDEVKYKWGEIENLLGSQIKPFFRHYVTHKIGGKNTGVYRAIQEAFPKEKVADLLNDLYRKSLLYNRISMPDSSRDKIEYAVLSFLKSKHSQQLRPLILSLLSAYDGGRIDRESYLSVLTFLRNFYICFTMISSMKSNKLTDVIEKYAPIIEQDSSAESIDRLLKSMKKKLPNFETFKNSFNLLGYSRHYEFYQDKAKKEQAMAALELIESELSPGFFSDDVTIEHIHPDSVSKESALIGNLTLIESRLNKKCENRSFEDKIKVYADSNFRMTRNLHNRYFEDPSKFKIEERAEAMASMIYKDILGFKDLM